MSSRYPDPPRQAETMENFVKDATYTITGAAPEYSIGSFWVDFVDILSNERYSSATVREFSVMMKLPSAPTTWVGFACACIKHNKRPIDVYLEIGKTDHLLLIELVARIGGKLSRSQERQEDTESMKLPELLSPVIKAHNVSLTDWHVISDLGLTSQNAGYLKVEDLDGISKSPVEKRALHAAILKAYGYVL